MIMEVLHDYKHLGPHPTCTIAHEMAFHPLQCNEIPFYKYRLLKKCEQFYEPPGYQRISENYWYFLAPFNIEPANTAKCLAFFIDSSSIPSIHSTPVKFLGCIIDGSLSDRNSSVELADKLLAGLRIIDKSHFNSTQKLWILQHLLIPWIQWPLLIYEIPISLAFKLE